MNFTKKACAVAILLMIPCALCARIISWQSHDCPDGSTSYTAGIQDDVTGISYSVYLDCNGATCIWPLYGPFRPDLRAMTPPSNVLQLSQESAMMTEPGAVVAMYMIAENGEKIRYRNFVDMAERAKYHAAWSRELAEAGPDGPALTMISEQDNARYTELLTAGLTEAYGKSLDNMSDDERAAHEVVHAYMSRRGMPDVSDLQETAAICRELATARTNVQLVSSAHGISVEPRAGIDGPLKVYDLSGTVVWSGYLSARTDVDLPAGTYMLQSIGRAVPVVVQE